MIGLNTKFSTGPFIFIFWSPRMTEMCSKEEHIWTEPIFTKYVKPAHTSRTESENLIIETL